LDLIIRKANSGDLEQILAVYRDAGLDTPQQTYTLTSANAVFEKMHTYPNYSVYVAETKKQIVGTFALLVMDNLAKAGAPSAIIEDVAVVQAYQRQGIGKRMMQFAIEQCKKDKCYKVSLSSNELRVNAHQFYESLGFARHGFSFRIML
jgi:GNAT superfamily N-acetyltransferase